MKSEKAINISTGCKATGAKRKLAPAPLLLAVGLAFGACTPSFGVARAGFTSDYVAAGSGFHQQIPMQGEANYLAELPSPWSDVTQVATVVGVSALLSLYCTDESCR